MAIGSAKAASLTFDLPRNAQEEARERPDRRPELFSRDDMKYSHIGDIMMRSTRQGKARQGKAGQGHVLLLDVCTSCGMSACREKGLALPLACGPRWSFRSITSCASCAGAVGPI